MLKYRMSLASAANGKLQRTKLKISIDIMCIMQVHSKYFSIEPSNKYVVKILITEN